MLHVTAKDGAGAPVDWTVELGSPGLLEKKYGWTKTTLKVNGMVTVDGWQAHDNKKLVSAMTVTTPGGPCAVRRVILLRHGQWARAAKAAGHSLASDGRDERGPARCRRVAQNLPGPERVSGVPLETATDPVEE